MFRRFFGNLKEQIKTDKKAFIVYSILRALVLGVLIRCIFTGNYESAGICLLALLLFYLPPFFEKALNIEIPTIFEIIIYLFIFAAEILGEIDHFYVRIPGWDTMLHTMNGFLCAAVGFSLVDVLNRKSKNLDLSPFYVALVGFCFSMTIGVLWEFFEFGMDYFFLKDLQKDFIIKNFASVTLDPNRAGSLVQVKDIVRTIVETGSGETIIIEGGYLDVGLLDTMKDLMVNFVGAVGFCMFGYAYIKNREKIADKHRLLNGLLIKANRDEE